MRKRILQLMCVVTLMTAAHAQQSHWAAPVDKTAIFMIDMERKWAEGVCVDNGVRGGFVRREAECFNGFATRNRIPAAKNRSG